MQHIENDMDDLFRKVAESYPLNEGQSQWNEIEEKMMLSKNVKINNQL